jgi:lipid A 3-O-deacylase
MRNRTKLSAFIIILLLACSSSEGADTSSPTTQDQAQTQSQTAASNLWEAGVGEGFRSSVHTLSTEVGAIQGFGLFGSLQAHDLALISISYGHMLGHTVGKGHFYRGNWELRGELFGGAQFSPSSEWVVGLTPHLRYNFATGSRFIPFLDAGTGVTATSIRPPDLSNTFEFNLQGTAGMHVFLRDDLALTLEARLLHMSCAGISSPNRGLNGLGGMIGLTFLF